MKRVVVIISLMLILTAFKNPKKLPKTIAGEKTPKTIALIHHKYLYFIRVKLNNKDATLLVDTGAASSLLDINQANDYKFRFNETDEKFAGVAGITTRYKVFNYKFDHDSTMLKVYPLGADLKILADTFSENGMPIAGILGSDFLKTHDAIIDYKNKQLIIHN